MRQITQTVILPIHLSLRQWAFIHLLLTETQPIMELVKIKCMKAY